MNFNKQLELGALMKAEYNFEKLKEDASKRITFAYMNTSTASEQVSHLYGFFSLLSPLTIFILS